MGSEFLGKRSRLDDALLLPGGLWDEELAARSPAALRVARLLRLNRFAYDAGPDEDDDLDLVAAKEKRIGSEFLGKRALLLPKRMGSEFLGRRKRSSAFPDAYRKKTLYGSLSTDQHTRTGRLAEACSSCTPETAAHL
ncbi:hypothetical protein V5799_006732 [Amblyomma americanum]|uniref:Uncharacterized protein n=1 Tax=Amblyomma americanum TaxID=6943 RepID=A0AAQ4DVJ8_AMBAM